MTSIVQRNIEIPVKRDVGHTVILPNEKEVLSNAMTQIAGSELTNIGISVSRVEGVTDAFNRGLVTIHLPVASNKKLSAHFEAFLLRF